MTLYDLAICVKDEEDITEIIKTENGEDIINVLNQRKKEGDIIECRLHSETLRLGGWGKSETTGHIMVTVDMTDEEAAILKQVEYDDGSLGEGINEGMMLFEGFDTKWEANKTYYNIELNLGEGNIQSKIDSIQEDYKIFVKDNKGSGLSGNKKPDFSNTKIDDLITDKDIIWKCIEEVRLKKGGPEFEYKENDYFIDGEYLYKCIKSGKVSKSKKSLKNKYKEKLISGETEFECLGKKNPKKLKAHRFNIPLEILKDGWCPNMDLDKTRDKKFKYQPFIDKDIIIDSKEKVSLIKDKVKGSFKYKTKKIKS